MFIFQFLFGGVRIGDVFRLERKDIEEKDGVKWINFTAQKTIEHQKSNKVKITSRNAKNHGFISWR